MGKHAWPCPPKGDYRLVFFFSFCFSPDYTSSSSSSSTTFFSFFFITDVRFTVLSTDALVCITYVMRLHFHFVGGVFATNV